MFEPEYTNYLSTIPKQLICYFSMLHVLRIFSCGYLVQIRENSILFSGNEFLVWELLSLKRLNVLSIILKSFSAVQKLMSSQKFQSCTQCLEHIGCDDPKSFALAELKHLEKLGFSSCGNLEELKFCCVEVAKARECFRLNGPHWVKMKACHKLWESTCYSNRKMYGDGC